MELTVFVFVVVGLPVLAVLDKRSVEGTYIGRVLLIWIFALAPILLVIAPKVYRTWHANRNPDQKNQTSRVFISGLNDPTTSGSNLKNAKPIVKTSNGSGSAEGSGPKLHNNDDKEQALPCRVSANDAMVHFSKNSERLDV